jgi:REP element-mobilizing transposase RayT
MPEDFLKYQRKSFIKIGGIYFWTATINNRYTLLEDDHCKKIIIDSLAYLTATNKITVYAFVVMPNHIHLIWQIHELNGKETAQGSFLKYTAHAFKKYLVQNNPEFLKLFAVNAENKKYEFWQRDSLAFELIKFETAIQKLNYIHSNPVSKKWNLAIDREKYFYSSANFYENGISEFGFLKNLVDFLEEFDSISMVREDTNHGEALI